MKTGVIGLGDMGSGIAKNLLKNGFEVTGLDLSPERLEAARINTPRRPSFSSIM